MKKLLLTVAMIGTLFTAQAQSEPKAVKKPEYMPDVTKQLKIDISPSIREVNDFLVVYQQGPYLDSSKDLTGAQITALKNNASLFVQRVQILFNKWLQDDRAKFTADTTKNKPTASPPPVIKK